MRWVRRLPRSRSPLTRWVLGFGTHFGNDASEAAGREGIPCLPDVLLRLEALSLNIAAVSPQAAGKFPLKLRDEAIAAGLALLRTKGLIPADDSDDDVNYAEAAGVEW